MTPAHHDLVDIEAQARALRAAYFLKMVYAIASLPGRLRPSHRAARA